MLQLSGKVTLGENIADNGGTKLSYYVSNTTCDKLQYHLEKSKVVLINLFLRKKAYLQFFF